MKHLYEEISRNIAKSITGHYSTSFSIGTRLLGKEIRSHIFSIYAFVRLADEIVDTYSSDDSREHLDRFVSEYKFALDKDVSFNPVIHAFTKVCLKYGLENLTDQFLESMYMDLEKRRYTTQEEYEKYILGSARVVGLMCLKVFVEGDEEEFNKLQKPAMKLGSAFQKVNFLRDLKDDYHELGRVYFPRLNLDHFDEGTKSEIISEIKQEFHEALQGIRMLPDNSRLGVLVAYNYYMALLKKLESLEALHIMQNRVRISNGHKLFLLFCSLFGYKFKPSGL